MPNWVQNRLILSGSADNLQHFCTTCIRPQRHGDAGEHEFDFEALVPMPPEIVGTIDDRSDAAGAAALSATGCDSWHEWSLANWSVKWNATDTHIHQVDPETLDLLFSTAWNSPELILQALAVQFPRLKGLHFAQEPSNDWGLGGYLEHGGYKVTCATDAAHLRLIVRDCTANHELIAASAKALIQRWPIPRSGDHSDTLEASLATAATERVKACLAPGLVARLEFCADFEAFEGALNLGNVDATSERRANAVFFSAEDRCRTDLDLRLMAELVDVVRWEALCHSPREDSQASFKATAARLATATGDTELRAWATLALFRSDSELDMADSATLAKGFTEYAIRLYRQAEEHLNRQAETLTLSGASEAEVHD